jgi:hypothetical protein
MRDLHDINDYLRRLAVSVLLCPVAAGAWLVLALSGFSFDGCLAFLGTLSHDYAGMNPDQQWTFRFQVFATWGIMAFGFMFLSYVISPPHFGYRLRKDHDHWITDVLRE